MISLGPLDRGVGDNVWGCSVRGIVFCCANMRQQTTVVNVITNISVYSLMRYVRVVVYVCWPLRGCL